MEFLKSFIDFVLWFYPFVIGGLIGYIVVSHNELINLYKKVKTTVQHIVSSITDNFDKIPSKNEIEKRQKLVPIYLTIISILTALIKINGNYSKNITNSLEIIPEAQLGFLELLLELLNIIILSFNFLMMMYFLFIILLIGYYSFLDSQSIRQANKFGIGASICFGIIFSIDLHLLTSSTNLVWEQLLLLVPMVLLMSLIVAFSLLWVSNEKRNLKWPVKEQNSNVNKKDK